MTTEKTRYGTLHSVTAADYYPDGGLLRCIVKEESPLTLPFGQIVPQYIDDGKRKKLSKSVTFYSDGSIESLFLQTPVLIATEQGEIPAEMISFYPNGAIKRIFPSFGSISAFWTEKDEYEHSPELTLILPSGAYRGKLINLLYYETGALRSVTFWPKDSVLFNTPVGEINARIGIRFYQNGGIYSLEPKGAAEIQTPIGLLPVYDPDAKGIDGDNNSLVFTEEGAVASLLTAKAAVTVLQSGRPIKRHAPNEKQSAFFDNVLALEPMRVSFEGNSVSFGGRNGSVSAKYTISKYAFAVEPIKTDGYRNTCDECDG